MDVQQIRRLPTTVFRPRFGFLEMMGNDIQFSEGTKNHCPVDTEKSAICQGCYVGKGRDAHGLQEVFLYFKIILCPPSATDNARHP
jgi:hypothetical protein